MLQRMSLSLENGEELYTVAKALNSQTRIQILRLLNNTSLNVNELAHKLGIPKSTASGHIQVLEESGLIISDRQPGIHGHMKLCSRNIDSVSILLHTDADTMSQNEFTVQMPIGSFTDCHIVEPCGMVGEHGPIDVDNAPQVFYNPDRMGAQLIWFTSGYVEYRFPKTILSYGHLSMLEVSFEACAEAPYYRQVWPSDITVWMNGHEIATWTCGGDFGDRRGKLNPGWWPNSLTQYGNLKRFQVDAKGSYIDSVRCSSVSLHDLKLSENPFISVRLGIKDNAVHAGGMNIFGEKFGDFAQNIVLKAIYATF